MGRDLQTLMNLEVPIVVRLGEVKMPLREVINLVPGSIIELQRSADEELELLVNNLAVGFGTAAKVGENFGIRISYIGDPAQRVDAVAHEDEDDMDDDALAEAMLSGQL